MPKLQELPNGQFTLTLPKPMVKAKDWQKGDVIAVKINKQGNLELIRENP